MRRIRLSNRVASTSTSRTREATSSKAASCFEKKRAALSYRWVEFGVEAPTLLAYHETLNFHSIPKQVEYLKLFTICVTRGRIWQTRRLVRCARLLRLVPKRKLRRIRSRLRLRLSRCQRALSARTAQKDSGCLR